MHPIRNALRTASTLSLKESEALLSRIPVMRNRLQVQHQDQDSHFQGQAPAAQGCSSATAWRDDRNLKSGAMEGGQWKTAFLCHKVHEAGDGPYSFAQQALTMCQAAC